MGELIPIANATQNGLLSKQTVPSTLYIRNKTYIELHHSLPADWNTFMFLLMISGTGIADGDAILIIHGSNKSNSEGRCIAKSLYGNLPKSLQLKWEQKPDKSIHRIKYASAYCKPAVLCFVEGLYQGAYAQCHGCLQCAAGT